MRCHKFESCAFFNACKNDLSMRQYTLLVDSYCDGQLQSKCRRMKWQREQLEPPPLNLCPNGYLVGEAAKFYD